MYHLAADLSLFLFCLRPVHVMFFHMPQLVSLLPSTIQSPLDSHMLHHIPFHFRPEKIATYCIFHVISHIYIYIFFFYIFHIFKLMFFPFVLLSFRMRPTGH